MTLPGRCAAICGRFPSMASKPPQSKKNAVLGRLWPKEECGCSARENHLQTGFPPKPGASGFGGRRRSDRESELCRWRQSEGFVVRLDGGQHRVCLVTGKAAARLPPVCGALPHTLVGAKSAPFGTPYGSGIPNYAPLRLLSKRNPLTLGFRLVLEHDYFGGNHNYRLSRDEDEELNSLNNQRKIIYNFAVSNGHEVIGESFDDNVSGMHFNREGIDKIYEVVEAGKIEAIIVKDLSRLGRHRTQTALFIDYLRERNVRVLSATENIDTFNENDDLIIGFKGLVNDFYARDGSRRVRTGYRQKQKEGIVTIPPFGYFKDKNTKKVVVVEEAAETVRMIFSAYIGGSGMKAISSHRVHEEVLDAAVQEFAQTMRVKMAEKQKELKQKQKMWALRKPVLDAHILLLQEKVLKFEQEIDEIVMEKLRI